VILARQPLTAIQMLTIAAGYGFYFPLILYLSANFSTGRCSSPSSFPARCW
jgi:hypothetical protein